MIKKAGIGSICVCAACIIAMNAAIPCGITIIYTSGQKKLHGVVMRVEL